MTVTPLRIMTDGVEYVIVLGPKVSVWSWAKIVVLHFNRMRAAVSNALSTAILFNGLRYVILVFCHREESRRFRKVKVFILERSRSEEIS